MQIPLSTFDESDFDYRAPETSFKLTIDGRVLIEVVDYHGYKRSAFRTVVTEFSRPSGNESCRFLYNPNNLTMMVATIVVDVGFSDRQEAISKAHAVAASYQTSPHQPNLYSLPKPRMAQ